MDHPTAGTEGFDTKFYDFLHDVERARAYSISTQIEGVPMDREIAQRPHRVTAVFQHTQLSFDISRGASLAQLVEQLSVLGEAHGGLPLSVDVRIAVESTR